MKTVTKYQARDGREFACEETAKTHEGVLDRIDKIMSTLPARPDDCEFSNGRGYIQHDWMAVTNAKNHIIDLWHGDEKIKLDAKMYPAPHSIIGRFFDDANSPLRDPWYRLMCIDPLGREWDQPYFALHPDCGNQIRLNP